MVCNDEYSPLVSVIIPIFNVEKYLQACVDSVVSQTYTNIEIILVDDGSPDMCPEICDEYAVRDKRIKVIHKTNGGLSSARNAGYNLSEGEFIYFLDSDDYIIETALEELLNCIRSNEADFVFFDALEIYDNVSITSKAKYGKYQRKYQYNVGNGSTVFLELMSNNEYRSSVPMTFIRATYLRDIGINFCEGIVHEDQLFTFLLFYYSRCVTHLQRTLYIRRFRANSITTIPQSEINYAGYSFVLLSIVKLMDADGSNNIKSNMIKHISLHLFFRCQEVYHILNHCAKQRVAGMRKDVNKYMRKYHYFKEWSVVVCAYSHTIYLFCEMIHRLLNKVVQKEKTLFDI